MRDFCIGMPCMSVIIFQTDAAHWIFWLTDNEFNFLNEIHLHIYLSLNELNSYSGITLTFN